MLLPLLILRLRLRLGTRATCLLFIIYYSFLLYINYSPLIIYYFYLLFTTYYLLFLISKLLFMTYPK